MRYHTNKAKIEEHAYHLHGVTVYPHAGIEGMHRVKEGGKEKQRERVREQACLDREKIPCRGSQGLKSSAKEGAPALHTHTHTHPQGHSVTPGHLYPF